MGLDYRYVDNGNDLETMISVLEEVKDIDHPIVVHINTLKGEGYQPAIERKREFHWMLKMVQLKMWQQGNHIIN